LFRENQLSGTRDWRLRRPANQREFEGYALVATVTPGQRVPVAVSASEARNFRWFVYRLGYYGGTGARGVARGGPLRALRQPACPVDASTGMVACQWTPTVEIETTGDWVRGVYLVKLVREDGYERYVPFFVRDANPRAEVVAVIPTATWAAYNTWGGTSLYDDSLKVIPYVLVALSVLFLALAAGAISGLRKLLAEKSTPLSETLSELKKDIQWIRSRD
jgi:hypothetical protein